MLITISPAKTLDFSTNKKGDLIQYPVFTEEADHLIQKLKKLSPKKIASMMDLSDNLAELNYERFQNWEMPFDPSIAREALSVFKGDVYLGLEAETLSQKGKDYLEDHLIILSGLYGVLRPSDSILPYRLEMGRPFKVTPKKKNLYHYWDTKITDYFNQRSEEENSNLLINLASNEYFKSIQEKKLRAQVITPEFKDLKNGTYKTLSFFAKKARGSMLRYMAEYNINEAEEIKSFDRDGYYFNHSLSTEKKWVFTRDH